MSLTIGHNYIPIVFFGRLEERKGLCTFIEAIQLLDPELRNHLDVTFLGKVVNLYTSELRHLNSRQYIDHELDTKVSYRIISDLYSEQAIQYVRDLHCPIVCLASPQENFPNSALEMGQLPISLVVADTGGFRETLKLVERESGIYWFNPRDTSSLAQSLKDAVNSHAQPLYVCSRSTLEQVNKQLLDQKLKHIQNAFSQADLLESPTAKVTIALTSYNQGKYLIDCLSRIEAQTYTNIEAIVLDDASTEEYSQEIFEQAKLLFSNYQFIKLENSLGLGAILNYALNLSTGDYFLHLDPYIFLRPFAVEKLVRAAFYSGASIVTCARKEIGKVERVMTTSGTSLPAFLKSKSIVSKGFLCSISLLKQFGYTERKDIQTQNWEVFAAAVAMGKKIISYPYPLYEYLVNSEMTCDDHIPPREQYSIRQYLAQIPPKDWSHRQIYMLLTAVQQLQSQHLDSSKKSENEMIYSEAQITLQAELLAARNEIEVARNQITAIETSKFWKLRKVWLRFKQFIGLS